MASSMSKKLLVLVLVILFVANANAGELEAEKEAALGLIQRLGDNEKALIDQISGIIGSPSSSPLASNGKYWDLFIILTKCVTGLDGSYKDLKLAFDAFKKGNYLTAKLLLNDAFLIHLTCQNNIALGGWPIVKGVLFPPLQTNQQLFEKTIKRVDAIVST